MQFLDQAKIYLQSGKGGNGCISFRREKYVEFGGPDGGAGGKGGDIIFEGSSSLNTLIDFRYKQHYKARKGTDGSGKNCTGARGEDIIIKVPIGTQIISDIDKESILQDITKNEERVLFLKGGNGGFGNTHFKNSMEQAPRRANPGLEGEEIWVWLRLKTLADVGLLGLPNVGKSSLLSAITNAKPKIGNYAYTTLTPQLGIIKNYDQEIVLADIPGLISDAHKGVGIGTRFLGHIERCKILLHVIDADSENHIKAYQSIMKEIKAYGKELKDKKQILVISKADLIEKKELTKIIKKIENYTKSSVIVSSSLNKEGLDTIINTSYSCINKREEENNNKEIKEKKWSP